MRPAQSERRRAGSGSVGLRACVSVAVAALGVLAWANPALATDFAWSGAAKTPSWSEGTNWAGGIAPGGPVGVLSFPVVGGSGCAASPTASTCYQSMNDSSVTVSGINVDDGVGYTISGNAILLGAGGLTAAPAPGDPVPTDGRQPSLTMDAPLDLEAPQTWAIGGGPTDPLILIGGAVTGPASAPLAIEMRQPSNLAFADAELGTISVTGDGNPQDGDLQLGFFDKAGAVVAGSLNATSANAVGFAGGAGLFALDGTIGPLSMASGIVQIGEPDHAGMLTVNGSVSIDPQSELLAYVSQPGTIPGTDFSELSATGNVNLAGAVLLLGDGETPGSTACEQLRPNDKVVLVRTAGTLTGAFAGVPDGRTVSLNCFGSGGTPPTVVINYDYVLGQVTATVASAGTPAAPSTTALAADPAAPVTNQPVTLTARVASSSAAAPIGSIEFDELIGGVAAPIPGCGAELVSASGGSYSATCATSFAATDAPILSAVFVPGGGSTVAGSASSSLPLAVGPAATTTTVAVAPASVGLNQTAVYTATVTASQSGSVAPGGSVNFFVDGQPVAPSGASPGCTGLRLGGGPSPSTALCKEVFSEATGTRALAITATYGGDPNFAASTASAQTLTVVGPPAGPGGQAKTTGPAPGIGRAAFGRADTSPGMAEMVVTCKGSPGQTCLVTLKLSTHERLKHGKVVSATAGRARTAGRPVAVGARTVSLAAGRGEIVHVKLNAAGRRTLARLRRLPAVLAATQKTSRGSTQPSERVVTFTSVRAGRSA